MIKSTNILEQIQKIFDDYKTQHGYGDEYEIGAIAGPEYDPLYFSNADKSVGDGLGDLGMSAVLPGESGFITGTAGETSSIFNGGVINISIKDKSIDYTESEDGTNQTISINPDVTRPSNTPVIIPDEFNGKPVTTIGSGFNDVDVIFDKGTNITTIEKDAFKGNDKISGDILEDLGNLTTIGESAFEDVANLGGDDGHLDLPNKVETIGANAFKGPNDVTKITIPNSVTAIGAGAFSEMDKLEEVSSKVRQRLQLMILQPHSVTIHMIM